jgi:PRC-barrel domain
MKATMKTIRPVSTDELERRETFDLISADKVEGTAVYNRAGEKLGTVDKIMIDKTSGRVAYAVMSFGGFLGMGESYHPLPWNVLTYDTNLGGYVVDLDPDMLKAAPTFGRDQTVDWRDEAWNRRLHDYYGVPPYWL